MVGGSAHPDSASASTVTDSNVVSAVSYSHLDSVARTVASQWGEPNPTGIQSVTGLQHAEAVAKLTGETVENASGIVDVVQEHGDFQAPSVPYGQPAAEGHVLTIVVSRETGLVTDISLAEGDNHGQELDGLGAGAPSALP
jgi:hypothetical protein